MITDRIEEEEPFCMYLHISRRVSILNDEIEGKKREMRAHSIYVGLTWRATHLFTD